MAETAVNRFQKIARKARPSTQKASSPTISAVYVPTDLKQEIMEVSRATGDSMSKVVRTFAEAHRGRLAVEYEKHKRAAEGTA